jgi:hypothetical protein
MAVEHAMIPLRGQPAIRRCTHSRLRRHCHHTDAESAVRYLPELTVRQARQMLASWAADHRAVNGRRDEVARTVTEAGLIKSQIHRLTGITRSTLDRILGTGGGGPP